MTAPNTDPLARTIADLHAARQSLQHELRRVARRVAEAEADNRRVRAELNLVLSSKMRQRFLGVRGIATATARAVTQPIGTARRSVATLRNRLIPPRVQSTYEALAYRATPLRHVPILSIDTDQDDPQTAVRWLGPRSIRGLGRQALFCHPRSSVTFRTAAAPGAKVTAACALLPEAWAGNRGGVEFTIRVEPAGGGWTREASLRLDPGVWTPQRRWHTLSVSLPASSGEEILVTLATRLPEGASPDHAWAVWGDPRVQWRRRNADLVRSARVSLRQGGLRGTLRRLRNFQPTDEQAALYRLWVSRNTPGEEALARMREEAAALDYQPLISVITPVYNTDPALLRACIESVRRQVYGRWELCLADDASPSEATKAVLREYAADPRIKIAWLEKNLHISGASNAALAHATGEFVAMLDHDDELTPEALFEVARYLNTHRDADMIYSDEDKLDMAGGRCDAYFKPDWSPEHFLNCMYTCHLMVLRRSLVEQVGGFRLGLEGAQDYDIALRVTEQTDRIHHIPKILYHWRKIPGSAAAEAEAKPYALKAAHRAIEEHVKRRGLDADVLPGALPGLFRVKRRIRGNPLVSILITTDDRSRTVGTRTIRLLPNAVRSIVQKTTYPNYELVIIDNGRLGDDTRASLETVPHRRVSYTIEGSFNFAHKLNFSARHAQGEHLVVFNDDLEVISSEWLSAMLEHSQDPQVGVVGGKLYFPDGRLQHIGMVLGVGGTAAHAFHTHPGSSGGYASAALGERNYSAVTGACMMTRRAVFEEVGGFNERLATDFNDVDYCLRVRHAGYRVVFTPYAELYHHESGTLGPRTQNPEELAEFLRTWNAVIDRDPYYNPNLTREFPDYRLRV